MSIAASPDVAVQDDIAARLERLPMSRWHVTVRLIIGVVTFFEAFDQLLIAYTLPSISQEWNISATGATVTLTVGSVGMLIGALLAGWIADKIGRIKVIAVCVAVTALASLAMGLCTSLVPFLILRFVQGLAIGGEVPTAASYISEMSRAKNRGRFVLLYETVFPAGLVVGSLAAAWIIPHWGWRPLYLLAAVPGVAAVLVQWRIPESPRWLAARGDAKKAEAAMRTIEDKVQRATGSALPEPAALATTGEAPSQTRSTLRDLFTGRYRRRTLVVWTIWFIGYLANYGVITWLPSLYTEEFQVPMGTALWYSTATSITGLLGCILAALTIDRLGRRSILAVGLGGATVLLLVLGVVGATSAPQLAVLSGLAAMFTFGVNISLYLYTPELYPTRSRALGCSMGGVLNRIGLITGPVLVGVLYAGGTDLSAVFLTIGVLTLVGTVVAGGFAEETKGRTLEELSP